MFKETYEEITSRLPLKMFDKKEVYESQYTFPKSTKKEDILDWLIKNQFIDFYVIKLIGNDDTSVDDVIQDIYLSVCEMKQEDWDKLTKQGYGAIRAYISGMVYRQVCSSTSPSYYKYRRYNQNRISLEDSQINEYSSNE